MRAIAFEKFGGPEVLSLHELPSPEPGPGEVRIAIAGAGVNPVDWKIVQGLLQGAFPHGFPLIPGWEAAGVIDAVGEGHSGFAVGDRVYAYCRKPVIQHGAYAEQICLPAEAVAPAPSNVSLLEAAGVPLAGLTAWQSLFGFADLQAGESVLIHGGAGGVGGYAVQLARNVGARVISTARRENHAYVQALGAERVVDYTTEDVAAAVRAFAPDGVDVAFDTVGGETLRQTYELVRPGGRLVGIVASPDQGLAAARRLRAGYVFVNPDGGQLREMARLIERGAMRPLPITVLPLEQAAEAHELSRARHTRGKLVLQVR